MVYCTKRKRYGKKVSTPESSLKVSVNIFFPKEFASVSEYALNQQQALSHNVEVTQ